jgi:hypothetical protein
MPSATPLLSPSPSPLLRRGIRGKYAAGICILVACVVCAISSLISFNCAADKKWQCAQVSGFFACLGAFFTVVGLVMTYKFA